MLPSFHSKTTHAQVNPRVTPTTDPPPKLRNSRVETSNEILCGGTCSTRQRPANKGGGPKPTRPL